MAEQFDAYYKWLGIAPDEQPPHHYRLLGVRLFEDDADVIANAADQRMSHLKSFQSGQRADLSQKLLNEVAAAQACLLDSQQKSAYDQQLKALLEPVDELDDVEPLPQAVPKAVQPAKAAAAPIPQAQPQSSAGIQIAANRSSSTSSRAYSKRKRTNPLPIIASVGVALMILVGVLIAASSSSSNKTTSLDEDSSALEDGLTIDPAATKTESDIPVAGSLAEDPPAADIPDPPAADKEFPDPGAAVTEVDPPMPTQGTNSTVPSIAAGESEWIWIEGESATINQVAEHNWYNDVKRPLLSGGGWAGHFAVNKTGYAAYDFQASSDGTSQFWLRANPVKCKLSWRLNEGPWQVVDFSTAVWGKSTNVAANNKPDLRFIAWNRIGDVNLRQGANRIEFRLESDGVVPQHHGAVDCFCFTNSDWQPSGIRKPESP